MDDYKLTACCGLLRWFHFRVAAGRVTERLTNGHDHNSTVSTEVPILVLLIFSIDYCLERVRRKHSSSQSNSESRMERPSKEAEKSGSPLLLAEVAEVATNEVLVLPGGKPMTWQVFFKYYYNAVKMEDMEVCAVFFSQLVESAVNIPYPRSVVYGWMYGACVQEYYNITNIETLVF